MTKSEGTVIVFLKNPTNHTNQAKQEDDARQLVGFILFLSRDCLESRFAVIWMPCVWQCMDRAEDVGHWERRRSV